MTRTVKTPHQVRKKRRSRGALAAIGALLIGSGLLRLVGEAGPALASAPLLEETAATAESCPSDADFEPLIAALQQREARLEGREAEISRRMQAVTLGEEQIDARLAALAQAEQDLRATLALASTAAEDDLGRLTEVYANMKPKQAAALFEEMAPEFAAGFLGRMRADAAAGIMAGLSPQAAYSISVMLAGRNASAPSE